MTPKQTAMKTETVCFGDCLEHLKQWIRWNNDIFEGQPSLADLIYLDPPWNSKANYNVLFGSGKSTAADCASAQETAFTDMWQWNPEADRRVKLITGDIYHDDYSNHPAFKSMLALKTLIGKSGMLAYLSYMAERLALLRRLLKETGSIYLHCDPTMSHYLKLVMDEIFGAENFRNEIIWKRHTSVHGSFQHAPKQWGSITDTILFYARSPKTPIRPYRELTDRDAESKFPLIDKDGRRYYDDSSHIFNSPGMGKRPNQCYEWRGFRNPHPSGWRLIKERLEEEYQKGNIVIRKDGKLERRKYQDDFRGTPIGNFWDDIPPALGDERQGYPTQKPLALLKRIIEASTNPGDVVLDPFCGCGTAVVAAAMLKRKFVGVDISLFSVETMTYNRLQNEAKMPEEKIKIMGIPADFESARRLAKDDPFAFEIFGVEACVPGMVANKIQRADKGIDGKGWLLHPVKENGKKKSLILAQVKAGKPTLSHVRDFAHVIQTTEGAIAGVFITVEKGYWTDGMREVAAQLGTFKHEHSMDEFKRLQHWHIGQFFYKSARQRLPHLPELSDPYKKEKVPIRQTGFLTKQYGR